MEWVLLGGAVVGAAILGLRVWRLRAVQAESDEPSAHEFVWAVLAGLEARGVSGWPEDGTFAVRLADGRQLPLQEAWRGYARASGVEARKAAVEATLAGWAEQGLFRSREAFVQHAAAVLREAGHAVAPDVDQALLELADGTVVDLQPVWQRVQGGQAEAEALAAVADDVAALDEVQPLPLVVGRAQLALEALAGEEKPAADLGAGLAVRPARIRGAAHRLVDFDVEVLADAVQRLAEGGHRFGRGPGGVLASGFGDPRDAGLLLMPEEGFQQLGIAGPVVLWPITTSEVLVGGRDKLLEPFDAVVSRLPVVRPLSLVPLVRVEALRWAPLELPEDHELHEVLRGLACEQRVADYARLQPALEERSAVARMRVEPREGGAVTVAAWTGPCLIPAEVDEVEVGERRVPLAEVRAAMTPREDLGLPYLEAGEPEC